MGGASGFGSKGTVIVVSRRLRSRAANRLDFLGIAFFTGSGAGSEWPGLMRGAKSCSCLTWSALRLSLLPIF